MPGHKKPIKYDTLTFVNEEMKHMEVIKLFQIFGLLKYVNKYKNRFFIQFESPDHARKAQSQLGRIYRVTYAHAKSSPRPRKNLSPEGELIRLSYPENWPECGYPVSTITYNDMAANNDFRERMAMIEEFVDSGARWFLPPIRRRYDPLHKESLRQFFKRFQLEKELRERTKLLELQRRARGRKEEKIEWEIFNTPENMRKKAKWCSKYPNWNPAEGDIPSSPSEDERDPDQAAQAEDEEDEENNAYAQEEYDLDEYEREAGEEGYGQNENEEEGQQAGAHALGEGTRRSVGIEGLDQIMQELGTDIAYSVIVANIPERYTLDEVYDLVEEVKPIAFSEMNYSARMRVKFCEVFLNDAADVEYLKQKLNDFVICGKQLTVMEPAEILNGTAWNL